jgi:hypothetical protein
LERLVVLSLEVGAAFRRMSPKDGVVLGRTLPAGVEGITSTVIVDNKVIKVAIVFV